MGLQQIKRPPKELNWATNAMGDMVCDTRDFAESQNSSGAFGVPFMFENLVESQNSSKARPK